jgi:hypothetical protein
MADIGRQFVLKTKFETVENLNDAISAYFTQCKKNKKPATIERLAEFLDCSDRTLIRYKSMYQDWEDYEDGTSDKEIEWSEKLAFCHPIKKAYQRIKAEDIERLKERGNSGDIFVAKNHGYKDERSIEHSGEIKAENPYSALTVDELKELINK